MIAEVVYKNLLQGRTVVRRERGGPTTVGAEHEAVGMPARADAARLRRADGTLEPVRGPGSTWSGNVGRAEPETTCLLQRKRA